jgi:hypothetical protein
VQRINPTGFTRVGALIHRLRLMKPTSTMDPITGGITPGPPELVIECVGGVEPFELNVVREVIGGGGMFINVAQLMVTIWYVPGVSVGQYWEWVDAAEGRTRHLEIMTVRDQAEAHRYIEMLCQEKVT